MLGDVYPRLRQCQIRSFISLLPLLLFPLSINSEGLPNKGIAYYIDPALISTITAHNKPYILSLSGLSLQDNLDMMTAAANVDGITAIELNLACPNIPGKPTIAYDFEQMDTVLAAICAHPAFRKRPLGVKLAPYFDMPHYKQAADLLNKCVCTSRYDSTSLAGFGGAVTARDASASFCYIVYMIAY